MKKLINLLVSLMICGLMLLSGCGTPSTSLPSELVGKTTANPDTLNIVSKNFFWNRDTKVENAETAKQ